MIPYQDTLGLHSALPNQELAVPDAVTLVRFREACANAGVAGEGKKRRQPHFQMKKRAWAWI